MDTPLRPYAFHAGERLLQESAGADIAARMTEIGPRVIRREMPEQHRQFFPLLPYVIVGALDEGKQPWATILAGPEGFVSSPDPVTLQVKALPSRHDPAHGLLRADQPVALLGIQAHTRRRNRANGRVGAVDEAGFSVQVTESFGNCPKYIQARAAVAIAQPENRSLPIALKKMLSADMRRIVVEADTFFIASAHPDSMSGEHGIDVSHRGGKPGFVRIADEKTFLIPDFSGNNLFNTLGNIALDSRVGLLFIDYGNGDLLHIAGRAEIVLDGPDVASFAGAQRLLRVTVDEARLRLRALPLKWSEAELSPHLEATGRW